MTRRRGLGLAEMLLGLAVLAVVLLPTLAMMSGARGSLARSRDALLLEDAALRALGIGRGLVRAGDLADLGPGEEEVVELDDAATACRLVISRDAEAPVFVLAAEARREGRWLALEARAADPLGPRGDSR